MKQDKFSLEKIRVARQTEDKIGSIYQIYKEHFKDEEKNTCEEYIYQQGEYEDGLLLLLALINKYGLILDRESAVKAKELFTLMNIDEPDYFGSITVS